MREVVGSRPGRGNSKESFSSNQETGKVFSPEMNALLFQIQKILKYVVLVGKCKLHHMRLPLMRHPATLKTMPIPANYYYYTCILARTLGAFRVVVLNNQNKNSTESVKMKMTTALRKYSRSHIE